MRKILMSLGILVFVGALAYGATGAFFSDTETSTGNVFAAGAIDLLIDNESYVTDPETGQLVHSTSTSWQLDNLDGHLFFNFFDLKPGDIGEDTISIHVNDNDAWLCAATRITDDSDVDYTEPELDDDLTVNEGDPEGTEGELDDELNFVFWHDDGDNVFEEEEAEAQSIFLAGPISNLGGSGQIALADASGDGPFGNTPIPGGQTVFVGKAWCFGDLTQNPVANGNGTPVERGTGFDCDGTEVDNAAQTDRVEGDIQFYAEQWRNNENFTCENDYTPEWPDDNGEQQPDELVGANLSLYEGPNACDVTASSSIAAAVASSTSGQTVCVPDGTYDETIVIDKPLTLAAENGPLNSATITGGVQIDSSDVTVTGFIINPGDVPGDPGDIGVFLNGSLDNILISYNDIDGSGGGTTRGVLTSTGATYNNVVVDNNVIHDLTTGIYTNPVASGSLTITNNDIDDNAAGIGGFNGATVTNNEFEHTTPGSEAIGIDGSFDDNNGVANFNNFLDDMEINTYDVPAFPAVVGTVDAENNFFSTSGAAQTNTVGGGTIDFTPEAGAAYTHN